MIALFKRNEEVQKILPTPTGRLETTLERLSQDFGERLAGRIYNIDVSEYLSEYSGFIKVPTKIQDTVRIVLDDYLNEESEAYFQINENVFGIYLGKATKAVAELKIQVIRNELGRAIENIKQKKRVSVEGNCGRVIRASSSGTSPKPSTRGTLPQELTSKEIRDWSSRAMLNMTTNNGFEDFQADIRRLSKMVEIQFKPLWYVPNNLLSGYIVETTSSFSRLEYREKQAQEDLAVLAAAVRHLKAMTERNEFALLIVPVFVHTICDKATRDLFNIYCHSIEPKLKRFLVLRIKGIDVGKMNHTDWDFLNSAAFHCRSIIIEPPRKKINFKELPRNFHAFGLDLTGLHVSEEYLFNLIEGFADHYQKSGRHTYLLGVQTKSL